MSRLKVYNLATASFEYVGGVDPVSLATDSAMTSRYMPRPIAAGHAIATALGTTGSVTYTSTLGGSPGTNPVVTLTTGTDVIVLLSVQIGMTSTNAAYMSYAVSGATTLAASDNRACLLSNLAVSASVSFMHILTGLTPGSNVFTLQYRTSANTHSFTMRALTVLPI